LWLRQIAARHPGKLPPGKTGIHLRIVEQVVSFQANAPKWQPADNIWTRLAI
jgi:hypothetical protein